MKLFGKRKQEVKGYIGYFGLANWWLDTFSEQEREYMETKFQPMSTGGVREGLLTRAEIGMSTQSVGMFLSGLASWFRSPPDRHLARKILEKSEAVIDKKVDIIGLHFTYRWMIEIYYRDREKDHSLLGKTIEACEKQILIAPEVAKAMKREFPNDPLPSHTGYTQLIIIKDKQGQYEEAIRLCKQAKNQGWGGTTTEDWETRIGRYQKKLQKT